MKENIYKDIADIVNENKKLKKQIDEAIEYISHYIDNEYRNGRDDELYLELNHNELKELLDILKGSDKK